MQGRKSVLVLVVLAAVIGVGLRLLLAYAFYGNTDQRSYEIVVATMERGGNLYAERAPYPYSPLWANLLLVLSRMAGSANLPFHFVVRGFLTLVDIADAWLIGLIASRIFSKADSASRITAAVYLLSPVAVLIVGYHGQFDNLATLPLLVAVSLYLRRQRPRPLVWIWVLGALSIIIKHITLFSVVVLFLYTAEKPWRALLMLGAATLVFLAAFLPYAPGSDGGILDALQYQGTGVHGPWRVFAALLELMLPHHPAICRQAMTVVFICLMGIVIPLVAVRYLRFPLVKSLEISAVAFRPDARFQHTVSHTTGYLGKPIQIAVVLDLYWFGDHVRSGQVRQHCHRNLCLARNVRRDLAGSDTMAGGCLVGEKPGGRGRMQ